MATATLNWYFSYNGSNGDRCGLDVDYFQFSGSSATFPATATNINSITIYFSDCLAGNFPGSSSFSPTYSAYFTVLSGGSYINLGSSSIQVYGYNYRTSSYADLSYIDNIETILSNGISGLRMTDDGGYFKGYKPSGDMHMEINYEYALPSVTAPGTPTITQNNNGTFTASWSAATGSNGSGSVTYQLWNVTDGMAASSSSTSTNVTLDIPIYGTAIEYRVVATYSGATANSSTVTKTFTKPTLSTPTNVKLSAATGESTIISWTASSIAATTGTITYSIRKNGTQIATTTKTSYTFNKDVTSTWGTSAVTLTVVATASTVNKHYPSLTSGASSGVTFTYKKAQATITYYNGSSWVNCYVYYYDGSNWIAVNPYYYIDNLWKSCSTT